MLKTSNLIKYNNIRLDFESHGYLVLDNYISKKDCKNLIAEQKAILASQADHEQIKFDTYNQQHGKNKYFFESARMISLFYEPDAFNSNNQLIKPVDKAVNKIGHALHDFNQVFHHFSYQSKFKNLIHELGIIKPQIVQSMYLLKQPQIGNQVDLHQDSTFIFTEPESCIGLWFALEDANKNNGCLWAIPQSHKLDLKYKYIRNGFNAEMVKDSDIQFDLNKAIPLEVKAGTLIVLHGRLAHFSNYNHSNHSRHAYALHVVDQTSKYSKNNWLQSDDKKPFKDWVIE